MSGGRRYKNRVYAISNEGSLNITDTLENPGLSLYINSILPTLTAFSFDPNTPAQPVNPINPGWSYYKNHSDAMLSGFLAKFTQLSPYNYYCNTGAPYYYPQYVGCVPLAVGTVMGYYKWPKGLEGYTFSWDSMYASASDLAWARLFKNLGGPSFTNVSYGIVGNSAGTGASELYIPQAFSNAGYNGATLASFSSSTVNEELESGNTVVCVGDNENKNSGHAWVIDGGYTKGVLYYPETPGDDYKKVYSTYYHCVWGWGGTSNGYYLYSNSLGGNVETGDTDYSVSAPKYNNLFVVHGYRPQK